MIAKKRTPKTKLLLVELSPELKRELKKAGKKHDWSMRKAARHAIEAWVEKELTSHA